MKASGRAQALDLSLAVIGVVLTAVAVWSANVISTPFAGPTWLKVAWPLLIGAPLALRRRAPLLGWTIIWAGISLQALITGNSPEGLELMFVLGVGSYSVAAYSTLRRALAGLAVTAVGATIYGLANHDIMSGNTGPLDHPPPDRGLLPKTRPRRRSRRDDPAADRAGARGSQAGGPGPVQRRDRRTALP